MKRFSVKIEIMLRPVVLDPQGKAVRNALCGLGFESVSGARVGKIIELFMEGASEEDIREQARRMCSRFLCNPVIEDSSIEIREI